MEAAIELARAGDAAALDAFVEHARAYIGELLDCIASQEDGLFPLLDRIRKKEEVRLNPDNRACANDDACGTHIELARRLAEQFGVFQPE